MTTEEILKDIDAALALQTREQDENAERLFEVGTSLDACLMRHITPESSYEIQVRTARQRMEKDGFGYEAVDRYRATLRALRRDIECGRYQSAAGRAIGGVISDLLGQADELLEGGYLLPAAVVAGASLEEHLRNHCIKAGVTMIDSRGKLINANTMNAKLKDEVKLYEKAQHAQVDAWQKARNAAAHNLPEFNNETPATIKLMIAGIRDFLPRYPLP